MNDDVSAAANREPTDVSRRAALRIGAATTAAVLLAKHDVLGQPPTPATASATTTATTTTASTMAATIPTTLATADPFSADDVAIFERLTGDADDLAIRTQLARGLSDKRGALHNARAFPIADGSPPAFHFDPFAPGIARYAGADEVKLTLGQRETPAWDGDVASLAFRSVADLHGLLIARKVTSVALTRMCLDRIKSLAPKLFCVITLLEDRALQQAADADRRIVAGETGVLLGIPYGLKDLFAVRGTPLTLGAKPFEHAIVDDDADIVRALAKAGAVLLCKTSLGELAMGNVWFGGETRNPWKLTEGSSGSSAGSAAGVAAGLYAFAIGTETHGSIISPCTVCGVTGLRPTFGRVSRGGGAVLSWTMDKVGAITRYVEDAAIVFHTLHQTPVDEQADRTGRDSSYRHVPFAWEGTASLDGIRVGIDRTGFDLIRRDTAWFKESGDAFDAAAAQVAKLTGKPLIDVHLPPAKEYAGVTGTVIDCEGSAAFAEMRRRGQLAELVQQADGSWPNTFRVASMIPAVDYLRAMQVRTKLQLAMADAMNDVDVIVATPTLGPSLPYANLCGLPAVVTRGGVRSDGSPLSIQFIGRLDREDLILRVAAAYERATDWHTRWPTL